MGCGEGEGEGEGDYLLGGEGLDGEEFAVQEDAEGGVALFADAAAELFVLFEGGLVVCVGCGCGCGLVA